MNLGIDPPKGVLLFGPPGTGKTLCARAVANRTDACFIRVIGSELVQKYVGEVGSFLEKVSYYQYAVDNTDSVVVFKSRLKTFLFSLACKNQLKIFPKILLGDPS